jgi:Family of unknown function (DUF6365)
MNILFVTPNTAGSGEAITALHMGVDLAGSGHSVHYFADPFTARFLRGIFPDSITEAPDQPQQLQVCWTQVLSARRPACVIFADYPLLNLSRRWRPLLDTGWREALARVGGQVVTLDHLGLAQGPLRLSFGPPQFELALEHIPAVPEEIKILLPCPLQSPAPDGSRRGIRFRCWRVPLWISENRREAIRRSYLDRGGDLLVVHTVSSWAMAFCRRHGLPNYRYFHRTIGQMLGSIDRGITLVSINGGSLLQASSSPAVRIVNVGQLAPAQYDELILASDLVISDNRLSVTLGKAACGFVACAAFRNSYRLLELVDRASPAVVDLVLEIDRERPGAVFPFEVFPIWSRADVDALGVLRDNALARCVALLELFGGEQTISELRQLLTDPASRDAQRNHQRTYVDALAALPAAEDALMQVLSGRP